MDKYECPCGYEYDPRSGDYNNGIEAGTVFKKLPDNWACPLCEAEKEFFEISDE
ncbi:MAG: rubredoxin [Desulfobacteraceae bacterium]